jgi:hypothetical protein
MPVAHSCNPSYSGGTIRAGTKPAQASSFQDHLSKKPSQKRAGGVAQSVGSEFKPQYCEKKKTKNYSTKGKLMYSDRTQMGGSWDSSSGRRGKAQLQRMLWV